LRARVGVLYNDTLDGLLDEHPEAVEFVSVIPDRFWIDRGRASADRFADIPEAVATLNGLARRFPLVAHGVGLSIASASTFDFDHIRQLARWRERFGFSLIGEHLSAFRVRSGVTVDHHAGLQIPIPWDENVLEMLVERVIQAQEIIGDQLILENGVVHTPIRDSEMSEPEFLCALVERSGCGLLLDLHNLYVNSVNLGIDADAFVDALPLHSVREIHMAGGHEAFGIYLDSHAGSSPDEVRRLLGRAAPRCRALDCVTFEFHESYFPRLGRAGIRAELAAIEAILQAIPE
jgi:uncharacterized protein